MTVSSQRLHQPHIPEIRAERDNRHCLSQSTYSAAEEPELDTGKAALSLLLPTPFVYLQKKLNEYASFL